MNRKKPILQYIFLFLSLIYLFTVFVHVAIPKSKLNIALSKAIFFVQFYAFPILFSILITLITLILLIVFLVKFKSKYKLIDIAIASLSIIILASSLLFFGASSIKKDDVKNEDKPSFKIVSWNTLNELNEGSAKEIFIKYNADVGVFPEFGGKDRRESAESRLQGIFSKVGLDINDYSVYTSWPMEGSIAPVCIVVKKSFYVYEEIDINVSTKLGLVYLKSNDYKVPSIIGIHTAPPLPGLMEDWRSDIELVRKLSDENPSALIAGDFNATLRHGEINKIVNHQDVLMKLSIFKRGTWPAKIPSFLRSSIDHIFLPKSHLAVKKVEIKRLSVSDHCAIFAEIYLNL